jgi:holliday junction DNA helicase RuvA
MIGFLRGMVVNAELDGRLVVDVRGVGYELSAPLGAVPTALPSEPPPEVTLYVHTHVREDALDLFGFATPADRTVFRQLIGIPGVGPRTALGVLSALPPTELASAIEASDVKRLQKISGIGKKSAERLVLELKGKLQMLAPPQNSEGAPGPDALDPASRTGQARERDKERVVGALTTMGYRTSEAERAVKSLGDRVGSAPLQDLVREALAALAG